ncbi:rect protein [Asaia sp. W19]|uniref:recombinase RecT n=2 Tax=unclassified Asaia TaxID=2685023 RepID=UPI000F8D1A75|nr:recombinase RecT [Asaia sp. W19]RUT26881.1 rect protein [Asaia sp. W19]
MSNALATPTEKLRTQITSMTGEFRNALPSHIKPEKFQRVVMTVVQQNQGLMNADRKSLLASCLKCAADGLIPDGREAALVMFGQQVQYMPMLAGIQKRIRNSGEIASIQAHVIYENDHFVWHQGVDASIEHRPLFPGDRGKAIGAYAVAKFKDGSDPQFEVMDVAAIEKVRAVSRAGKSGPWVQWWDEMARKTVFRRLSKWLPMDTEAEDLMRRDDENDAQDVAAPTIRVEAEAPSKLDALERDDDGVVLEETRELEGSAA